MDYYVYRNDQQTGPYSAEQISAMLSDGQLGSEDLVWHDGITDWKPIRDLFPPGHPTPPAAPVMPPSPASASSPVKSLLRKIRLASTLGALLLFFLPWVDIQCSGTSLATQTGIQVIYGGGSPSEQMKGMSEGFGDGEMDAEVDMDMGSEESMGYGPLVGMALLAVLGAVACSFIALRTSGGMAERYATLLPTLALALLLVQLLIGFPAKREMINSMREQSPQTEGVSDPDDPFAEMGNAMAEAMMANFQVKATPAFYLELVALGIPCLLLISSLGDRRRS